MIDINKQYTTRDGREVQIYRTDAGGDYPVHGAIKQDDGTWVVCLWRADGRYPPGVESDFDLVEAKPRIKGWLNVYELGGFYLHSTREEADKHANSERIACIEIDVPHGHGLEGT